MTQNPNNDSKFAITGCETVTVTLDTIGVQTGALTHAAFDETVLKKTSAKPDIYIFPVDPVPGEEPAFAAVCSFIDSDPASARYTIRVASDKGGSFAVSPVYKEFPQASFQLFFQVA